MVNNSKLLKKRKDREKSSDESNVLIPHDPLTQISELSNQSIQDAEEAISSRKKLTEKFLKEIEKEIAETIKMLNLLGTPWKHGDRTEYEFMRISLDKALTARKKERRERLLQSWKDMLQLQEKRIELLRESLALGTAKREITKS